MFGGKVKSFDAAKVASMPGVKKVVQVGDTARRGGGRHLVAGQDRARRAADRVGRRRERQGLERLDRRVAQGRPRRPSRPSSATRTATPRPRSPSAAKKVEAVYAYPYQNHARMEPMNATALYTADKCEVWVPDAERRSRVRGNVGGHRACRSDKCEVYKIHLGGGFGRRGAFHDYVTQAVLIAKEMPGTPVKLLWSREEDMLHGRYHPVMQCKLIGGFDKDNNLTGLHMRLSGQSILADVLPADAAERAGSAHLPGPLPGGDEARVRLHDPEPADRPRHAQPARPAGLLARREHQPERHLLECFMDELAQAAGAGRARVPAQADGEASASNLAVLNAVAEKIGWGKPAPQGVYPRACAHDGVRQLRGGGGGGLGQPATRSRSTASSAPPIRATRSIRRRSTGRSRARSSTGCPRCSIRSAPSRTAASSRPTSTPTTRCASPRCRRSRSIMMPSGGSDSGAASASRRSAWRRPRCSMRISRRPASASARSR